MLAPGTTGFVQRLARSTSVMMLFDISNAKSFEELQRYYDGLPRVPPLILVGNKIDEESDYMLRWEQRTHFPLFSSLERYLESLLADTSLLADSSCITLADPIHTHAHTHTHAHAPGAMLLPPSAMSLATVPRATPIAVPSTMLSSHMIASSASPAHQTTHLLMAAGGTSSSPGHNAAAWLSSSPHIGPINTAVHKDTPSSSTNTNSIGTNGHHHLAGTPTSTTGSAVAPLTALASSPASSSIPSHHHHIHTPTSINSGVSGMHIPSHQRRNSINATHHALSTHATVVNGSPPTTVTQSTLAAAASTNGHAAHYCLPSPIIGLVLEYFLTPSPHVGGREVSREEAMSLARRWRVPYVEMSCKTQLGVRTALTLLLAQAMIACGHAISTAHIAQSLPSQLTNGHNTNNTLITNSLSGHALAAAVAGWPQLSLSTTSSPLLTSAQPLLLTGSPSNHHALGGASISHLSVRIPSSSGDGSFSPLPSPLYNEHSMTSMNSLLPTVTSRVDARPAAPKVPKKVMWVPDSKVLFLLHIPTYVPYASSHLLLTDELVLDRQMNV
jgi:hypothetical protein